jgi:hypothetical protein
MATPMTPREQLIQREMAQAFDEGAAALRQAKSSEDLWLVLGTMAMTATAYKPPLNGIEQTMQRASERVAKLVPGKGR